MFKPELLSPAGTLKSLRHALAYGADAVYGGQPRYSLRVRNNEFHGPNLALAINETHEAGKKFYVVVNIAPHNSKLKTFIDDLKPVIEMRPDAFIMSDPGFIMLAREAFPEINVHLSVQANAVNWATVKFWQQMGLTRVILSRELSLEEIAEIRELTPGMELEVFVHGALCMAYSGRCLLSGYINKRDSNQGVCTNMCRWQYKAHEAYEDENGQIIPKFQAPDSTLGLGPVTPKVHTLEEKVRPGEYLPTFEDEHGTYIMNSKDLRAIQHVARLSQIGVNSLKIEGRTKSFYYAARTAQAYRRAIDDAAQGLPFNPELLNLLDSLAHRGYTEGFLRRQNHEDYQNYETGVSSSSQQIFVGEFSGQRRNGLAEVVVKNKFEVGDSALFISPTGNRPMAISHIENKAGQSVEAAPGDGHIVYLPMEPEVDLGFALLAKIL